ncbi:hypothetical protein BCU85_06135 [Vibrio lentus]|uniref:glycosyltransferase n=1 Tax=Vibrio lentus TaxID=136468 RepID=UPI000C865864|nr:glycosyltransferase [Vibrio lentus]MCC4816388.1 glycosyltransferase [Vibrio lentus]PMG69726.1 hypothetical protein BCU85_06135 [Vibrio lentus]PMK90287.1 hypothetical protein BCT88_19950 [Vibrio lentus]PML20390.1 hypothetical protein BCT80_18655 [Vibrio lentus]PMM25352.1 hypothetical protein BCT57_22470 [Vibrio lentus]
MKFSVLMSLYHAEKETYLELCLKSLMEQTCRPNEVVIVFDGPISNELESVVDSWCDQLNIIIVRLSSNVGLGNALNIGVKSCSYELVARMDTDDICHKDRFKRQLDAFNSNPELSICGTSIDEFDGDVNNIISQRCLPASHADIVKASSKFNPFNHMTVMYKKSHILNVGGYKHMPWMEDWYLWLRLLSSGYFAMNISESLVSARTGMAMVSRRSGFSYVRSEWMLTKVKVDLGLVSRFNAIAIFFIRAIPRLLPKKCLHKIYLFSRKVNG